LFVFFSDIVLAGVGGFLCLIVLLLIIGFWCLKKKSEKKRKSLLKKTGIFSTGPEAEVPYPKVAWMNNTSFRPL